MWLPSYMATPSGCLTHRGGHLCEPDDRPRSVRILFTELVGIQSEPTDYERSSCVQRSEPKGGDGPEVAAGLGVRGTDYSDAVEVVRNVEGWTDNPESTTTWRRGANRARRVIRSNRGLLNTLAGHLSLEGVLPRAEILRVIGGKVESA